MCFKTLLILIGSSGFCFVPVQYPGSSFKLEIDEVSAPLGGATGGNMYLIITLYSPINQVVPETA